MTQEPVGSAEFSPFRLDGRRAIVTGGTQGVGASIAHAIARAGADVMLVGLRDDELARETLATCRGCGVEAALLTVDLAQPPSHYLQRMLTQIDQTMPGVDLLVNNAGTYIDPPFFELE
jgi:NAD(P)-dependent dehydrogenase (short-subunit alcohol dehydrogenase family)